jgi:hypothetical protein
MWLVLPGAPAVPCLLRPAIRGGKRGRRKASQQGGSGLVAATLRQWENGEQIGLIPLPDLGPVLGPLGFCFLPVSCSGAPEPAPRVELAACSD